MPKLSVGLSHGQTAGHPLDPTVNLINSYMS